VPADYQRCKEYTLIKTFLSAYEDNSWADCKLIWLDKEKDSEPECLATRSDGKTLVIEHTLIQPFLEDKEDFARSMRFQRIEADKSLIVPERIIYVDVPAGALQKGSSWDAVINIVHAWLKVNITSFPEGISRHICPVMGVQKASDLCLQVRVVFSPGDAGVLLIRRYGDIRLGEVVEKALRAKLPKLVRTEASKRILLLERDQFTLDERSIYDEVEKRRAMFPDLAKVHEVWFAETVFYEKFGGQKSVFFNLYDGQSLVKTLGFWDGQLIDKSENGIPFPLNTASILPST
jgi:hypothetical protein